MFCVWFKFYFQVTFFLLPKEMWKFYIHIKSATPIFTHIVLSNKSLSCECDVFSKTVGMGEWGLNVISLSSFETLSSVKIKV